MSNQLKKHKHYWPFPRFYDFFEEFPKIRVEEQSGMSVYEDESHIVIEAALPGLSANDIEVSFEKGNVWIKGSLKKTEEDKKRNYYQKFDRSYSYNVSVPFDIDESQEPTAEYKDGMMTIRLAKSKKETPRKITVKQA